MEARSEEAVYMMALTMVPGIGPSKAKNLIAFCGSAKSVFNERKSALLKIPDIGPRTVDALRKNKFLDAAKKEFEFTTKYGIQVLLYNELGYPVRLRNCDDSPVFLFFKGNTDLNTSRVISVVGTRSATAYGKQIVMELLGGLKDIQPLVVSGLAYGIDIAAHRYALQYKLPTIACLAHGLDRVYPPLHTSVAREMLEQGGLLTEFPSGTNPDREMFPSRNRIIAGMSDCTIVVETDLTGGSIITAHMAHGYGREVFAFPGRSGDQHSAGCNQLIRKNIAAILTSPAELKEYMNWQGEDVKMQPSSLVQQQLLFEDLDDHQREILQILRSNGRTALDAVAIKTGFGLGACSSLLLELEFRGLVRALPGKVYEWTNRLTGKV